MQSRSKTEGAYEVVNVQSESFVKNNLCPAQLWYPGIKTPPPKIPPLEVNKFPHPKIK